MPQSALVESHHNCRRLGNLATLPTDGLELFAMIGPILRLSPLMVSRRCGAPAAFFVMICRFGRCWGRRR
jgi:hypothetical protein